MNSEKVSDFGPEHYNGGNDSKTNSFDISGLAKFVAWNEYLAGLIRNIMEKNRVLWGSRRGMLELDLILQPFVENGYSALTEADQKLYQQLLEEQDQDMFAWLLKRQDPEDQHLLRIVQIIRDHTSQNNRKNAR